jgi:hypothetical protein
MVSDSRAWTIGRTCRAGTSPQSKYLGRYLSEIHDQGDLPPEALHILSLNGGEVLVFLTGRGELSRRDFVLFPRYTALYIETCHCACHCARQPSTHTISDPDVAFESTPRPIPLPRESRDTYQATHARKFFLRHVRIYSPKMASNGIYAGLCKPGGFNP